MRIVNRRSLAWKLTLAFIAVALIGALSMAFTLDWQMRRQFDRYEERRYQNQLLETLAQHYRTTGDWKDVDQVFAAARAGDLGTSLQRFDLVLLDADYQIVFRQHAGGDDRTPRLELPVLAGDRAVGWLRLSFPSPPERDPAARDFLHLMSRAIGLSVLFGGAIAFVVGLILARTLTRPIHALTAATRAMTRGALGKQVTIETQDELGELGGAFNQMSQDLARSIALRRQMTADIAHDLRTPLSVILGYAEALHEGKFQGNQAIYTVLHEAAQQLGHLIDDLRTLSLADAGELSLQRTPMAPRDLLTRVAAVYQAQAADKGVTVEVDAAPDLPVVAVDAERVGQVLGNLVTNALRYTAAGDTIRLSAQVGNPAFAPSPKPDENQSNVNGSDARSATWVLLQVLDTGQGIDPADLPHIFERFFRGDKSRHSSGESGLGLAIAKSVVEMHNGTIHAESQLNRGTTFTIALPALTDTETV